MDFDDLEEAAAERIQHGDVDDPALVAAMGVPEPPGPYKGGFLPRIDRNVRIPSWDHCSRDVQSKFHREKEKLSQMRLFVFYGAGDSYPAWMQFASEAPVWCDVVVYEWPSHGTRMEEQVPADIDGLVEDAMEGMGRAFKQHAKGRILAGAPFAFLGHSIGVLVMVGVAHRIRCMFGIEPDVCFVLDRAAPEHALCSTCGARMLKEEPETFMRIFNPMVNSFKDDAEGQRMMNMWINDIRFQEEGTKLRGYHMFACPLHVCVAMGNYYFDSKEVQKALTPQDRDWNDRRCSILGSHGTSSALWDYEAYLDWKHWTSNTCTVHDMQVDHNMIKVWREFHELLWKVLEKCKAPA